MNSNDIAVAMMFAQELGQDEINLVCAKGHDIPYVRRALRHMFGEPDRLYENTVKHMGIYIHIINASNPSAMYGLRVDNTYYVSYEDECDWDTPPLVPYIKTSWFNEVDIHNAMLLHDNMLSDTIIPKMHYYEQMYL